MTKFFSEKKETSLEEDKTKIKNMARELFGFENLSLADRWKTLHFIAEERNKHNDAKSTRDGCCMLAIALCALGACIPDRVLQIFSGITSLFALSAAKDHRRLSSDPEKIKEFYTKLHEFFDRYQPLPALPQRTHGY